MNTEKPLRAKAQEKIRQIKTAVEGLLGDDVKQELRSILGRMGYWTIIITGYLFGLVWVCLLLKSVVEGFQGDSAIKWETLASALVTLLFIGLFIRKKAQSWDIAKVPLLMLAAIVAYSALRFPTSDSAALTLFGRPAESLLNPAFLMVLLVVGIGTWTLVRAPFWCKVLLSVVLLYCGLAFGYGMHLDVGLEESFLGVDFFSYIPYFFLQPTYLAIHLVLPLAFFLFLYAYVRARKEAPQKARWLLTLLGLLLLCNTAGFAAMGRNRVPNLFSRLFPPQLGVGEATTSFTDASGNPVSVRITTRGFEKEKSKESADFYRMALSHLGGKEDQRRLNLSVMDTAGKDVLFLDAKDFEIYENTRRQRPLRLDFELGGVSSGQNIILLLDYSGSMSKMIDELRLAAKTLVDLKSRKDKVVIVPFAAKPNPQPISDDIQQLKAQIDNTRESGGTGLYRAILTAYGIGAKLSGPTTMVVMTDGEPTDRSEANQRALAEKTAKGKLRLYTVGLGESGHFDEPFLQDLAKKGNGKYFRAEAAKDLKEIYRTIGAELQSKYTVSYVRAVPAPEVHISKPDEKALVIDPVLFTADVVNAKEAGLARVEFFVDEYKLDDVNAADEETYSVTFDPSELTPGAHTLMARAYGAKDQQGQAEIEIEVQRPVEFRITRPADGDSVGNAVPIEADLVVRTEEAFRRVEFKVDGKPLSEHASDPLMATWDSSGTEAGEHELSAEVFFGDGISYKDTVKVVTTKEMTIQFHTPKEGAELPLDLPLQIQAHDERQADPIVKVVYSIAGKEIGMTDAPPFSYQWDSTALTPGKYILRAKAITKQGKTANASVRGQISTGSLVVDLEQPPDQPGQRVPSQGEARTSAAKFFFPPENVEIILDASNSMWGQLSGGSKMDIAKQVLARIVAMIPEKTKVALRVYGSKAPVSRHNCTDTQLLQPLVPLNRRDILTKIQGINPLGKTPIAYSLLQSMEDLTPSKGASVALLITDGMESCDGDPVAAAKKLHTTGIKTKLHVIGYDVDDAGKQANLAGIAKAGGGRFFSAGSSVELTDAIVEAATVEFRLLDQKGREVLKDVVGAKPHKVRSGQYELMIDLEPPMTVDSVNISPKQNKIIYVKQEENGFKLVSRRASNEGRVSDGNQ